MRIGLIFVTVCLAACGQNEHRQEFDGHYFRAKLSKVERMRDQFSISVSPVSQSLAGAREAGRYEATKYCISQYGSSDMTWVHGPDAEATGLHIQDDTLILRGACDF